MQFRYLFAIVQLCYVSLSVAEPNYQTLYQQADHYYQQGQYHLALDDFSNARKLAESPKERTQSMGMLGLTHYRMQHSLNAESLLQEAVDSKSGDNETRARWYMALAQIKLETGQPETARKLFNTAQSLGSNFPELRLNIALGQIALLAESQQLAQLQKVTEQLSTLNPASARIPFLINMARYARRSDNRQHANIEKQPLANDYPHLIRMAYQWLEQAKQLNDGHNSRFTADIFGLQAEFYEAQQRREEALYLNEIALDAARSIDAEDLLTDLEWRQGRLLQQLERPSEALEAYQRAVNHLEAIRQDIPVTYPNGRSSFRETLGPIYLGLADLLFKQADRSPDSTKAKLLRRAQQSVELLKQSELADFLGGRCALTDADVVVLDTAPAGTAVLYPVIFPDRLELLVDMGGELQHFSRPIEFSRLQGLVLSFSHSLRFATDRTEALVLALYQLLIEPIQSLLTTHQVKTLVWIPDGILRLVPPAALFDGKTYLAERYATATSPGISILTHQFKQRGSFNTLLAGVSEPGPALNQLPVEWQNLASSDIGEQSSHGSRAIKLPAHSPSKSERAVLNATQRQQLQDTLKLTGVEQELNRLQQTLNGELLLNQNFTVQQFQRKLQQGDYSLVHVATHGVFSNNPESSFVMAYDGLITLPQFEQMLSAAASRKQAVQLLTLSACQTAEGDDRAPLGISGIALKAKVQSTLGTLWPIADDAAVKLMTEFYGQLLKTDVTKAQALQQAQLSLLHSEEFRHPYFWSPYTLVGNWQ